MRGIVDKFNHALHVPKKATEKMLQLINIWEEISMVNIVKNFSIPGLIIHANVDKDIPWQEGESVALAWKGAKFIKTTELGHRRILRDDHVIKTTIAFIKEELDII